MNLWTICIRVLDKAWRLPMSGRQCRVVDGGEVRTILDELRENLPQETRQARGDCRGIALKSWRMPSEKRRRNCTLCRRERAKKMISQTEIVKQGSRAGQRLDYPISSEIPGDEKGVQRLCQRIIMRRTDNVDCRKLGTNCGKPNLEHQSSLKKFQLLISVNSA